MCSVIINTLNISKIWNCEKSSSRYKIFSLSHAERKTIFPRE